MGSTLLSGASGGRAEPRGDRLSRNPSCKPEDGGREVRSARSSGFHHTLGIGRRGASGPMIPTETPRTVAPGNRGWPQAGPRYNAPHRKRHRRERVREGAGRIGHGRERVAMLSLFEAEAQILERAEPGEAIEVPLTEAVGLILAEPAGGDGDQPPF